jgi:hypothetical protein
MGDTDSTQWPQTLPNREAIDFLGHSLTGCLPGPFCDDPVYRHSPVNARRNTAQCLMLPLEAPVIAQPTVEVVSKTSSLAK